MSLPVTQPMPQQACPAGTNATPGGGCCAPGNACSVSFSDDLNIAPVAGGPGIGLAPGQCPMILTGVHSGQCVPYGYPADGSGGTVGCLGIRECDAYTGNTHSEVINPGSSNINADIWGYDPKTQKWTWYGPNGLPATPPNWAMPPTNATPNSFTPTPTKGSYNPSSGWTPPLNTAPTVVNNAGNAVWQPKAAAPASGGSSSGSGVVPTGVQNVSTGAGSASGGTSQQGTQPVVIPTAAPMSISPVVWVVGLIIVLAVLGK